MNRPFCTATNYESSPKCSWFEFGEVFEGWTEDAVAWLEATDIESFDRYGVQFGQSRDQMISWVKSFQ